MVRSRWVASRRGLSRKSATPSTIACRSSSSVTLRDSMMIGARQPRPRATRTSSRPSPSGSAGIDQADIEPARRAPAPDRLRARAPDRPRSRAAAPRSAGPGCAGDRPRPPPPAGPGPAPARAALADRRSTGAGAPDRPASSAGSRASIGNAWFMSGRIARLALAPGLMSLARNQPHCKTIERNACSIGDELTGRTGRPARTGAGAPGAAAALTSRAAGERSRTATCGRSAGAALVSGAARRADRRAGRGLAGPRRARRRGRACRRRRSIPIGVITGDGVRLPLALLVSPRASSAALVLGLHGYGDYRQSFAALGPWLAARGLALAAYDQRGFGETDRARRLAGRGDAGAGSGRRGRGAARRASRSCR